MADLLAATGGQGGARTIRRPYLLGGIVAAGFVTLLLIALLARVGAFVPLGFVLFVALVVLTATNPLFGLVATLVASLLVPIPLAFHVGPFSLSIGRLLGFAFIGGWLAAMSREHGPFLRRTSLDAAVGALLLAFLLSIVANSASMSRGSFAEAVRTTLVFAVDYFAFFYAAVSVIGTARRHLDLVLRVGVLTVALTAVLGLIEQVTGRNVFTFLKPVLPVRLDAYIRALADAAVLVRGAVVRARSTFEGPHAFGAALVLATPLLIHYSATARRRRPLYGVGAILCGFAALFTASRGVYVALVAALVVYFVGSGRIAFTRVRALGVLIVVVGIVASNPGLQRTMSTYFRGLVERKERSVQSRLGEYTKVLVQFDKTPVAGSGPGTFSPRTLLRHEAVDPTNPVAITVDNYYLLVLGELGAAGFLAFVALLLGGLAIAIRGLRRARAPTERSLLAALVASHVSWLFLTFVFDIFAFNGPVRLYLVILAATMVAAGGTRARARPLAIAADRGTA